MSDLRAHLFPCLLLGLSACPLEDVNREGADETGMGESETGEGDTGESETGEEGSETGVEGSETGEEDTEEEETGEDEGDPLDPPCDSWTVTKVTVSGLDTMWGAGDEVIAGGGVDLVQLSGGVWSDRDDAAVIDEVSVVWGPAVGDSWVLGEGPGSGRSKLAHDDGEGLTVEYEFPPDMDARVLAGAGAHVWAAASDTCDEVADLCACLERPSLVVHFDGEIWTQTQVPGDVHALWTDGEQVFAGGSLETCSDNAGQIWRLDGDAWVLERSSAWQVQHLWGSGDELWAAAHEGSSFLHRVEGEWSVEGFAWPGIQSITGRGPDDVWVLTQGRFVHYDGESWSAVGGPQAEPFDDLVTLDGSLIAMSHEVEFGTGGYQRFKLWEIDEQDASRELLYSRGSEVRPTHFAFSSHGEIVGVGGLREHNYRFDGVQWSETYEQLGFGLDDVLGPADEGWAVKTDSGELRMWPLQGGEFGPVFEPPVQGNLFTSEVVMDEHPEGSTPWVGGFDFAALQKRVYQIVGDEWIERTVDLDETFGDIHLMAAAQGRVFLASSYEGDYRAYEADSDTWEVLPSTGEEGVSFVESIAATGPEALWATQRGSEGKVLLHWDGEQWIRAETRWPVLAGENNWGPLAKASDDDLWTISEGRDAGELLAHFDGEDWELIPAPEGLEGVGPGVPRYGLSVGPDHLVVLGNRRRWRLDRCHSP